MASIKFPGAHQILEDRKRILAEYDRARAQARAHEVEVYHGNLGEAWVRKWLEGFLPRRFGVTPGYVVSQSPTHAKLPQFDAIVYDQLASPVIWIEDNPDHSEAGRSRAIPVEYVHGVLEIKSALTPTSATAAIEHLSDLSPVLSGFDAPDERYCKFLPAHFFSFAVFLELREEDATSRTILNTLMHGLKLRGFRGATILRKNPDKRPETGRFAFTLGEKSDAVKFSEIGKSLSSAVSFSDPVDGAEFDCEQQDFVGMLTWGEVHFSQFAFDLVALLNGTYDQGRISSFYGFAGG